MTSPLLPPIKITILTERNYKTIHENSVSSKLKSKHSGSPCAFFYNANINLHYS